MAAFYCIIEVALSMVIIPLEVVGLSFVMEKDVLTPELKSQLKAWQQAEITGRQTYLWLARSLKDEHNRQVVARIAEEELEHYHTFRAYTAEDVPPNRFKIWLFYLVARFVGLTFGIKLLELEEERVQRAYAEVLNSVPEIARLVKEEEAHEDELLEMLDEEALKYAGSVVLGLNDALVELTGALAGLTLAFQNTQLIALTGLITGVSASLSMAASEYLSSRAEVGETSPLKSAVYTGVAYIFTVLLLILPYLLLQNYLICLGWTLLNAVLVIAFFNYYISVARDLPFGKRFAEMALISLGVATFSFGLGFVIRQFFGIEI